METTTLALTARPTRRLAGRLVPVVAAVVAGGLALAGCSTPGQPDPHAAHSTDGSRETGGAAPGQPNATETSSAQAPSPTVGAVASSDGDEPTSNTSPTETLSPAEARKLLESAPGMKDAEFSGGRVVRVASDRIGTGPASFNIRLVNRKDLGLGIILFCSPHSSGRVSLTDSSQRQRALSELSGLCQSDAGIVGTTEKTTASGARVDIDVSPETSYRVQIWQFVPAE